MQLKQNRSDRPKVLFWFVFPVVLIVLSDLLTKACAFSFLGSEVHYLAGSFLGLVKVYNPGGAFGLGQNLTVPLTLFRLVAVFFLFYLARLQTTRSSLLILGLLTGGALGNLYDNLSRWMPWEGNGMVRDFLMVDLGPAPGWWPDLDWIPWVFHPWPIFNIADSCITIGFIVLIFGLVKIRFSSYDSSD